MSTSERGRRLHLNRDGRWLDFQYRGLTAGSDGTLELARLPRLGGDLPAGLADLPEPGPAGLAIDSDGGLYITEPSLHRLLYVGPCDESSPVPCIGGVGNEPTYLNTPRGVLAHEPRNVVIVADTGNHRLQVFDRGSRQLVAIWGQPDGDAIPGTEPGCFDQPTALASDPVGAVYVVEEGNRRVQKFSPAGSVIPSFWNTLKSETTLDPVGVAVVEIERSTEVWILDRGGRLVIVDADGLLLYLMTLPQLADPMGLAVGRDAIYVGDNTRRRVVVYDADGRYVGDAQGYEGPVAALILDRRGGLIVHPGIAPMVRLALDGGRVRRGYLWGGPFLNTSGKQEQWHQATLLPSGPVPGTHVQLFVYAATTDTPPVVDEAATDPFAAWTPFGMDASAAIFAGKPFDKIWIGVQLSGEGDESSALQDIMLDFDYHSYIDYLPAIFREDAVSRDFLVRLLALLQTSTRESEDGIERLPALFDTAAAPAAWLPWLASWLAFDLDTNWSEEKQRAAIAGAFDAAAWRGTRLGLVRMLRFLTGLDVHISEPMLEAAWWALADEDATGAAAESSRLGYTTRLASAEPQGAVLDTTAVLDQSHLVANEDYGAALFDDVAHQFTVTVYRGAQFSDDRMDLVRQVIDREKPAHTRYQVCVVEPLMRVGVQARVGIDSIVGVAPTDGSSPPGHSLVGRAFRVGEATLG